MQLSYRTIIALSGRLWPDFAKGYHYGSNQKPGKMRVVTEGTDDSWLRACTVRKVLQTLRGKVAVVTGASRSAGRGIALALGEQGATVYVTGRSTKRGSTTSGQPETVEETAALVTARGGEGVAVLVDHTDDAQVAALFERVRREQASLDILVNNVWGGYENTEDYGVPFWHQPVWRWDKMNTAGVRAHFTATRLAVPLMLPGRAGLVVSTTFSVPNRYLNHVIYDVAKTAVNRFVFAAATELKPHGIAAVALAPGVLRNEYMLRDHLARHGSVEQKNWPPDSFLWQTESTEYIGRAVVALARDVHVMAKTGRVYAVGALAREYGFCDVDGRQPPPYAEAFPLTFEVKVDDALP